VRAEIAMINANLPAGMKLIVAYDTSTFIDRSIKSVFATIGEAILLVVLVIYFFLRNLRATIIPIVTIPVSLVGAFGLMYAFGFTVNTLTLLAMVLAIGLVVDDAIVVLETISRRIEQGASPLAATYRGAREVGFTLLAMNLSLVVVFVSILFMGGLVERLFREFSITLAAAMLVSLVVTLAATTRRQAAEPARPHHVGGVFVTAVRIRKGPRLDAAP
jgi:multidrug efflux pump